MLRRKSTHNNEQPPPQEKPPGSLSGQVVFFYLPTTQSCRTSSSSVHAYKTTMNKIMGAFGVMGLIVLLASCDARSVIVGTNPANITCSRDARTNLCLANLGRAAGNSVSDVADSFSMTYVPCSTEVLALVPKSLSGTL